MPVFSDAHNFTAHNNTFIDNSVTDNSSNGPSGIDILLEASNPDATYDSAARNYVPQCFPGTREQYIEDIVQWAIPAVRDAPLPLLWVNGAAGVGKSAVAHTSAEKIQEPGLLGASFFFSTNGRKNPSTFFPSIAYQLSVIFDDYRNLVNGKVLRNKTLLKKAMASQYRGLIVEPLVELERQGKGIGKRIVIVDGLDECEGEGAQCDIIKIVAKSASEDAIPLCWTFFSRPESHITATFSQPDVDKLCRRITLPVSSDTDGDIELYLRGSFNNILQSRGIPTTPPWPSDHDMKAIVKAANGLFIYAATVYRFIAQPEWLSLDEPLRAVLDVISEVNKWSSSGSTPPSPFAELDAFYLLILRRIPERILPLVLLLLGMNCMIQGAMILTNLLRLSKVEIHSLCAHLDAVLHFHEIDLPEGFTDLETYFDTFPDETHVSVTNISIPYFWSKIADQLGGTIKFYHKSFKDFLQDPSRSGRFCVRSTENRARLADHLWRRRLDYEEDYCFRNSGLVLAPGVPDSGFSLSYPHENESCNSLIKGFVYHNACLLSIYSAQKLVPADFRKQLLIEASLLFPKERAIPLTSPKGGLLKCIGGTRLLSVRGPSLLEGGVDGDWFESVFELNVNALKCIERGQKAGRIRPYQRWRNVLSKFGLFRKKSQDKIESGLYVSGRGSKAIFWYWEMNRAEQTYHEFRTINLKEGRRILDLWKESEGSGSGSEATSSRGGVSGSNVTEADGRSP